MPRQYHKNPRQITTKQMTMLAHDLAELGDLSGIVHDLNTDELIGGNQRSKIFRLDECEIQLSEQYDAPDEQGTVALGYVIWQGKKYTYRQVRWDTKTAEKANIVANKAGGTWDFDILGNEWEIDELLEWGFEPFELGLDDTEAEEPAEDPGAQVDRAEELREKWGVQPGQMWQLGEHRLICGDCTDADVVARLMGGERAALCVTDPPYNVGLDYAGNFDDDRPPDEYKQWTRQWFALAMDNAQKAIVTPGGVNLAMWQSLFDVTAIGCWVKSGNTGGAHGAISMFQCWEPLLFIENESQRHARKYEFTNWLRSTGVTARQIDVATSTNMGGHYLTNESQPAIPTPEMFAKFRHIFHSVPPEIAALVNRRIDGGFGRVRHSDVFEYSPTDGIENKHACPKPTALWGDLIENYCEVDRICYEPFSGSGTTLIACEQLGRKCRAVELSAAYCAVAIQRWVDMTGQTPELVEEKAPTIAGAGK